MFRVVACGVGAAGLLSAGAGVIHNKTQHTGKLLALSEASVVSSKLLVDKAYKEPLPSRSELLQQLQDASNELDVLVIGGGATGAGVVLDATTRGLKTALVEKNDFASGTSSRSTKLLHGGVRYLQNAIMSLDREQYHLVKEALAERQAVLASAPHLASPLAILLPLYKWWQIPYFWAGIKMYDLVAGKKLVKSSYFVGKKKALEMFPMMKAENLAGGIIYYDGQHDDSRMNVSIILSAIRKGAICANHVEVVSLLFDEGNGAKQVIGAHVRDTLTGDEWDIKAKCVINATGPFTDSIRKMNDADVKEICAPAAGVHVTLPSYYCSRECGFLDPATSDGRVIFVLPWHGKTIAGTTDRKCGVTFTPEATKDEIKFIMKELKKYFNDDVQVRDCDVLSSWAGIRPLVSNPSAKDTKSISRNHVVEVSSSKLVSISGGKWTTFRAMAKDTVDAAVNICLLSPSNGITEKIVELVEGGDGWSSTYYIQLTQEYGLDPEVSKHLSHAYGSKAPLVAQLAAVTGKRWPHVGKRLLHDLPYIEAEVVYAVKHEYACKVLDVIERRMRLTLLDAEGSLEIIPIVVDIMAEELHWDNERRNSEAVEALRCVTSMTYSHVMKKSKSKIPRSLSDQHEKGIDDLSPTSALIEENGIPPTNTPAEEISSQIETELDGSDSGYCWFLD